DTHKWKKDWKLDFKIYKESEHPLAYKRGEFFVTENSIYLPARFPGSLVKKPAARLLRSTFDLPSPSSLPEKYLPINLIMTAVDDIVVYDQGSWRAAFENAGSVTDPVQASERMKSILDIYAATLKDTPTVIDLPDYLFIKKHDNWESNKTNLDYNKETKIFTLNVGMIPSEEKYRRISNDSSSNTEEPEISFRMTCYPNGGFA
ncbi:MAG: hypothetical protein AAGN64_11330, partial [Bacteroidota bacterium]